MSGDGVGAPGARRSGARRGHRVAVLAQDSVAGRRVARVLTAAGLTVARLHASNELTELDQAPDAVVVCSNGKAPRAQAHLRTIPAVVVSSRSDRSAIDDALASGAVGFVSERDLEERLVPTVQAVCAGQLAIPAELRDTVEHPILSPREKQVMSMVVLGFTNREVANKLHVTETTVKSHLSSAYRKLRVRTRQDAAALILSNERLGLGILTLEAKRSAD